VVVSASAMEHTREMHASALSHHHPAPTTALGAASATAVYVTVLWGGPVQTAIAVHSPALVTVVGTVTVTVVSVTV
jgi:hypothetical protein